MARTWDIQPSAPRPRPTPRKAPPEIVAKPVRRKPTQRTPVRSSIPLKRRRQLHRRRLLIIALVLVVLGFVSIEIVLWQPWFRVTTVEAEGPGADALPGFVKSELTGTRFLVLPRNSIFFLPDADLRSHILSSFPNVSAVSLSPKGLTTLSVRTLGRASVFVWCGGTYATALTSCYETDAEGFIFATATEESVGTTSSTGVLQVYAPIADADASLASPVGAHLASPAQVPGVSQFVKAMRTLGADVVSVALHDDEADLYTKAGTRITYVIGKESDAAALATSAFSSLNLNDGSLAYVDLRFPGKVYFKKK